MKLRRNTRSEDQTIGYRCHLGLGLGEIGVEYWAKRSAIWDLGGFRYGLGSRAVAIGVEYRVRRLTIWAWVWFRDFRSDVWRNCCGIKGHGISQ